MVSVDSVIRHAEQCCEASGARLTAKRKQVLTGFVKSAKAMSAYELISYCEEHYSESLPAMSVYRILDFLVEARLVHRLNLVKKYVACAHIHSDHANCVSQFLICEKCSKVKEVGVELSTFNELEKSVQESGFRMMSPQLEVNCICDDCSAEVA